MSDEDLRDKIRPFLLKTGCSPKIVAAFLQICFYKSGTSYGDVAAYEELNEQISSDESKFCADADGEVADLDESENEEVVKVTECNRLFYFAIPPNVFEATGIAIKQSCMAPNGWTRVIIEKPFGRDLESCKDILSTLSKQFQEDQIFRIDHYLGKEMVQNLLVFRFGNMMFSRIWDRHSIECVFLTFKVCFLLLSLQ